MLQKKETNRQLCFNSNYAEANGFSSGLLFERMAFYGLLVVILLAAIPYGTVDPGFKSLFVFLACVAAAFRIIEGIINDSALFTDFRLLAPLVGILFLAAVQILPFGNLIGASDGSSSYADGSISFDRFETKNFILTFSGLLLAGETLLKYTTTRRRLLALIYLVLGIGIASALFGFARQFFFTENAFLPGSSGYAQFVNKNHFVFLMEMTLGLLTGLLLKAKLSQGLKLLFWVMIGVVCVSVISANSRGGILSTAGLVIFAVFVYFFTKNSSANSRENRKAQTSAASGYFKASLVALLFTALLFGMIVLIISFVGGDPVVNRIETIQSETAESQDRRIRRREFWQSTIKIIKENPVAGIGFGAYPAAITKYDQGTGQFSLQQAHNDYLELLANGGITAFLLMSAFALLLIKRIRKQFTAADRLRRASCFGAAIGIFGVALHSITDFGLHTVVNALVFVVLIVIATAAVDSPGKADSK